MIADDDDDEDDDDDDDDDYYDDISVRTVTLTTHFNVLIFPLIINYPIISMSSDNLSQKQSCKQINSCDLRRLSQ